MKSDVFDLLQETESIIQVLINSADKLIDQEVRTEISRPKVKSVLEHLRSALDYMAFDIFKVVYSVEYAKNENRHIYFPYSNSEEQFRSITNKYFPKLWNENPEVYRLIESIQPFACSESWIVDLCKLTNHNKHKELIQQDIQTGSDIRIQGINIMKVSKDTTVKMTGCSFNGVRQKSDFEYRHGKITSEGEIGLYIEQIDWNNYYFKGTKINIIELLEESHKLIASLATNLYQVI